MHKFFIFLLIFLLPSAVFAAVVSFDPQETTVGLGTPFLVGMTIDADISVNALNAIIDISEELEVLDASDGNSVINMWVERPHITDAHQIVFSGIIPGGFEGIGGKLITLKILAKREGRFTLALNPSSRMYENTPNASGQAIMSRPLQLTAILGKDNLTNPIPDTASPEPFVPVMVYIPDNGGKGSWTVSFQAQDKGSGVDHYEVVESYANIPIDAQLGSRKKLESLPWNQVVAPYIISDQRLSSYVYVRAIDKMGNIRYARLEPVNPRPWREGPGGYIIIGLLILGISYALSKRFSIDVGRK